MSIMAPVCPASNGEQAITRYVASVATS